MFYGGCRRRRRRWRRRSHGDGRQDDGSLGREDHVLGRINGLAGVKLEDGDPIAQLPHLAAQLLDDLVQLQNGVGQRHPVETCLVKR